MPSDLVYVIGHKQCDYSLGIMNSTYQRVWRRMFGKCIPYGHAVWNFDNFISFHCRLSHLTVEGRLVSESFGQVQDKQIYSNIPLCIISYHIRRLWCGNRLYRQEKN